MSEKRFTRDYPPFRDEFGCVNNLINGDSYVCGETGFINERNAIDTAIEVCRVFNEMYFENEQLKSEIQQYKRLLQDMGLLMSNEEAINIREDIADKLLKPLFKANGFDVDINTDDGFIIIPKGVDVE